MKKKDNVQIEEIVLNSKKRRTGILEDGCRSIKDLIAPASIFFPDSENELQVEDNYVRTYVLSGIQPNVHIGWLDPLFNPEYDTDTAIYIEPVEDRLAEETLTEQIAQKEAELLQERENQSIKNTTKLEAQLRDLYAQRQKVEAHTENLFLVEILTALYSKTLKGLNKNEQKLQAKIGKRNKLMPLYLRQDEGYRSILPFGINRIPDYYRTFGTGAAGDCFPFYNTEFSQENGLMIAINKETGTPIFINPFDKKVFNNANIAVFGGSGSGKTYFLSLLLLHFLCTGGISAVVDAEGEFGKVTKAAKGSYITIAPGEASLNPFDIDVEVEVDDDGLETGKKFVNVKEKVASLLNMLTIMADGTMTGTVRSKVSSLLLELYDDFGINSNPDSLFESGNIFDSKTGEYSAGYVRKRVPQFSDFHKKLKTAANTTNDPELAKLHETLSIFVKGGLYDMFDCQTSKEIVLEGKHLVTFNISKLEENILRPIGCYVVFSWIWDKFVMNNPSVEKCVILEECWMLIKESLAGSEYTGAFVEKAARRIRKRNGMLAVSSQNVREFDRSEQGKAVLDNTTIKFLFPQEAANIQMTQRIFNLSDGERAFLLKSKQGDCLIKTKDRSTKGKVFAFEFEDKLISKEALKNKMEG